MKRSLAAASMLIALFAACGSSSNAKITVTLAPIDGATNQALDVTVTATYSGDVNATDAQLNMVLRKNNTGSSLCTSITYNARVATCLHDPLEAGVSYSVGVSDYLNVRGNLATFTTAALPSMVTKQAVDANDGARRDIIFSFANPLSEESAPIVTVIAPGGERSEATDCALNDDRTQLSCAIDCADDACSIELSGDGLGKFESHIGQIEERH